ncbi:hypothetical protein [Microbacterium sp. Bi128]|uniref:hypothetical protein n=1 Tax=Microbacterium sp. Bi128 TaxID=2821115 RepID=UPI001DC46848|nr:hypothetical protein [Microbacterium sp. Bi128]CAH0172707.1 hypothetical protein SRABI128_01073 [Microbacterium sp. Bi128]
MSETFWIALLTGAFTLASGVVGVVLTHRYSRSQADAARREDRRRDARALIAQFVEAGTQWAMMSRVLIPAYYKAAGEKSFWFEFPNTDTGKALREHSLAIGRAAGELRLIVGDEELLSRITAAQDAISANQAMSEMYDEADRTGGNLPENSAMKGAFAYVRKVETAFQSVEARASELLRGEL